MDFHIAHRPSLVASLLEEQRRPRGALSDADILVDMSSDSLQLQMIAYPGPFLQLAELGYVSSFTDDNILHVSYGEHKVAVAFYLADMDSVEHALLASYEASSPISPTRNHDAPGPSTEVIEPEPAAIKRESSQVESWSPALGQGDTPVRVRTFPLPPRDTEVDPERMRLTVTRESPGSAEYPSAFSLWIEVLGPQAELETPTRDDTCSPEAGTSTARSESQASAASTESSGEGGNVVEGLWKKLFRGS